jgi:hypothetical protein
MSKKTRYFVLVAGLILAMGLTTGLVASYMGLPVSVFSAAAGPEDLQYVPADAAVVAYANVREVMNSNFRERFRKFEPDTTERDEFEQKTGVNIDQDIESVVAAFMTPPAGTTNWNPEGSVLVLARGRFEQGRLEALAVEHGARTEDYAGKRLLTHAGDSGGTEMALGFIDTDLVAFGSAATVKRAIDARGGGNVLSNAEMMRQIEQLDASNTWAVGRFDLLANSAHLPAEVQAHVPAIQWFSAATHINGGVSGVVKAEAKDDESAKNLREIVQGFLALAKMQSASRPEIKTVVDSLQVSGEGKSVALSFSVPGELFDALEALGKAHQAQPK